MWIFQVREVGLGQNIIMKSLVLMNNPIKSHLVRSFSETDGKNQSKDAFNADAVAQTKNLLASYSAAFGTRAAY